MSINKNNRNYQYKVIFSDVDGTLLDNKHQVPRATGSFIRKLDKEGILFVMVSGRMPSAILPIQKAIGIYGPVVCYNGGLVYEEEKILYDCQIDIAKAIKLKQLAKEEVPDLCCSVFGYDKWVVDDRKNPWISREEKIIGQKAIEGNIEMIFEKEIGIHKILFNGEQHRLKELEKRLEPENDNMSIAISIPNYLEITNKRAKKSAGIRVICKHYGLTLKEAIAFGDGNNDIDMLKMIGNSYAMANAPEIVKRSAANVTLEDNEHEGLLQILKEKFIQ